jgi:steroid delta-isomerase-like uncharacterized protein
MSEDDNKTAARRFFEEVWNRGDVSRAGEFLDAHFVSHNSFDVSILGPDEYGKAVTAYRAAFPDLSVTVEDVFAEGNRVAVRGTDRGTHHGEFMGRPASGRTITSTWIEIFQMEGGKAVEGWVESDSKRLLDQLAAPSPGA